MSTHDRPDIIRQIDALTGPGPDAATWNSTDTHQASLPDPPSPETMIAILLGMDHIEIVAINQARPEEDAARLLEDPIIECTRLLAGVGIWFGNDSTRAHLPNSGANETLNLLLQDVAAGDYAVSDTDRERILALLAHPEHIPVIHGPCLVTGIDSNGQPAPLGETFQHWFGTTFPATDTAGDAMGRWLIDHLHSSAESSGLVIFSVSAFSAEEEPGHAGSP
ncbi:MULTISPECIES: hypothetical protein [unclassified Crossiella]|uniref:hypothetical protein n=1 Tax=unclassified Crossiella TaxID=2620835 RepID=UPI001FFF1F94|nr:MULTISPECIES: hypothetical protein [unclassified Crossiella]MCK2240051.1 hypothetical protein [Crossiella sp. S99.2]MCK2252759.1 hypothetical protein [Crossiella sp. S99.1]